MTDSNIFDDRLYHDPNLAKFYDLDNGWVDGMDYCLAMAEEARTVLDLGCGTGLFLSRLSKPQKATGIDPAHAMLEIARNRAGGDKVTWIEADARTFEHDAQFNFIVLTGHAFQVFLSEDDQRAMLRTIARHITPDGKFIFDSRNPLVEEWRSWTPDQTRRTFQDREFGMIESWNDVAYDDASEIVTYQTHYRVLADQRHFAADSKIKFTSQKQIAQLLVETGLRAETWLGDWQGSEFSPKSPEIILIGGLLL